MGTIREIARRTGHDRNMVRAALRSEGPPTCRRALSFVPLIAVHEFGDIPFDPEAANLMLSLVSARYERA